jgi:hypothetical protein
MGFAEFTLWSNMAIFKCASETGGKIMANAFPC